MFRRASLDILMRHDTDWAEEFILSWRMNHTSTQKGGFIATPWDKSFLGNFTKDDKFWNNLAKMSYLDGGRRDYHKCLKIFLTPIPHPQYFARLIHILDRKNLILRKEFFYLAFTISVVSYSIVAWNFWNNKTHCYINAIQIQKIIFKFIFISTQH